MPAHRRGAPRPERRCHICDKTFGKTEHLERHIRSHTRDKPFTCTHCDKSFSRNDTLLRHWRSHNLSGPPPNASAAHARRHTHLSGPSMYPNQSMAQPQPSGPQSQLDAAMDNGYSSSGIQGYHQNFQDRHTEAASALLSLPQGVSAENSQNQPDQSLPFASNGQETSAQLLQGYAENALDPMLMGDAQIQHTTQDSSDNQFTQQFADSQQAPYHFVDPREEVIDIDPALLAETSMSIPADVDLNALQDDINNAAAPSPSPTLNGLDDLAMRGVEPPPGPIPRWIWPTERVASRSLRTSSQISRRDLVPMGRDFWNTCVQLFFLEFNSVFPVIHAPTYRPSAKNSALSIVTVAIGSLFAGARAEAEKQIEIFPKFRNFLRAECKRNLNGSEPITLALIQACVIAEAFGLITGQPTDPRRYWRQPWLEMLLEEKYDSPVLYHRSDRPPPISVSAMWKTWAIGEARRRTLHCAYILGTELTSFYASGTQVAEMKSKFDHLPMLAPDEIWQAPTAHEWYDRISHAYDLVSNSFLSQPDPNTTFVHQIVAVNIEFGHPTSRLTAYMMLERIIADIQVRGSRGGDVNDDSIRRREELSQIYTKHLSNKENRMNDHHDLAILWHMAWIEELVDYHTIASCFGSPIQPWAEARDVVRRWASSPEAQRCLLHAVMIERYVSRFMYSEKVNIHVPRALYVAGLVILAYTKFKPVHGQTLEHQEDVTAHDELHQVARSMNRDFEALRVLAQYGNQRGTQLTRSLIDLLTRMGQFEASLKYADTLEACAAVESWEDEWVKALEGFAH